MELGVSGWHSMCLQLSETEGSWLQGCVTQVGVEVFRPHHKHFGPQFGRGRNSMAIKMAAVITFEPNLKRANVGATRPQEQRNQKCQALGWHQYEINELRKGLGAHDQRSQTLWTSEGQRLQAYVWLLAFIMAEALDGHQNGTRVLGSQT